MALPVINDVYRCALKWSIPDITANAYNVIHVKKSGSNPAAVAAILDARATAAMWGFQRASAHVVEVDITPLDGTSVTFPYIPATPAHWTGAAGVSDILPNTCNLIKLVTANRGRSYRGRVYLPWVTEALQVAGTLDTTTVSSVTAAWVTFIANLSSDSCKLQVASYKLASSVDVIAVICEKMTATQRRRQHRTSA